MKKSYQRLLIFELIIFIVLTLNSFVSSILKNYTMVIFIGTLLIIFKQLFGFEKDRHRYTKDIILEEINFLLIFFLAYYLLGMIIGYAQTGNYYTLSNFLKFILPLVIIIILKEYLRYMILTKSEGSKMLFIMTCLIFILIDISNILYHSSYNSSYNIFVLFAITILPAISTNLACSYITTQVGYKPVIFFLLIMNIYQYILPIIPNPNGYLVSVINLLVPALLAYRVNKFLKKDYDEEITRDYRHHQISSLIVPSLIIIFLVYLTSGYFHFYAVAVASGSMSPKINKGDVVIIEKEQNLITNIKEGQIIAYRYENRIIVHRLVEKITTKEETFFYTQGDANENRDNYAIKENMIIGIVKVKIPYIGIPTVWLNEL